MLERLRRFRRDPLTQLLDRRGLCKRATQLQCPERQRSQRRSRNLLKVSPQRRWRRCCRCPHNRGVLRCPDEFPAQRTPLLHRPSPALRSLGFEGVPGRSGQCNRPQSERRREPLRQGSTSGECKVAFGIRKYFDVQLHYCERRSCRTRFGIPIPLCIMPGVM